MDRLLRDAEDVLEPIAFASLVAVGLGLGAAFALGFRVWEWVRGR